MYGQQSAATGGAATLAYTGLNAAWWVTAGIGLLFAAFLILLVAGQSVPSGVVAVAAFHSAI